MTAILVGPRELLLVTVKVGLVKTRHQARLSVQDCSPGHAKEVDIEAVGRN
ncbi:hypothetical protein DPMN_114836 [Dreissena polymorpha]|uniref:Uncharacterized protein n=1 Tax=Dreissena polymorpha TaxID=45954 RepID=A0A9D4KLD3_DREPO|nr:hypothetical protein DPMN_114836 [Dreissena polymorpha]